jgi:hypothetical protein
VQGAIPTGSLTVAVEIIQKYEETSCGMLLTRERKTAKTAMRQREGGYWERRRKRSQCIAEGWHSWGQKSRNREDRWGMDSKVSRVGCSLPHALNKKSTGVNNIPSSAAVSGQRLYRGKHFAHCT